MLFRSLDIFQKKVIIIFRYWQQKIICYDFYCSLRLIPSLYLLLCSGNGVVIYIYLHDIYVLNTQFSHCVSFISFNIFFHDLSALEKIVFHIFIRVVTYIKTTYRQYLFNITVMLFVDNRKYFIRANSTSVE